MINLVGSTIEHYQILVKVRETPTRVLYKAFNTKSQTYIAIEVVKTSWLEPAGLLGLINEQVRKNAELLHPNIAAVTDTGLYEGLIYVVYNFAPTQPLRRFFNRTYPWQEMARELVSITHALAYAHEKGIVHGALHPSSIVLDEKRNPILFDFGFERLITDFILAHAPGTWINRWGFEYRAPEHLNGAEPTWQSDIYAIGIMLHEWLIGKIPLLDATVLGTLQVRNTATNIRVSKKETTSIPPVIQGLIQKCIARNPAERYHSMQEVYIVLARGALDMSITKKMVRKPLEIPVRRFKLGRLAIRWMSIAAGLAVFAVLAFMNRSAISAMLPAAVPATLTPTKIQTTPTLTPVKATSTTIPTQAEASLTSTPLPYGIAFPVFQATPISAIINQTINPDNIDKLVMLSIWGIGDVNRLVPAPDGKYVAAASSIGIFIFDAANLQLEKHIDTRSWITALEFSPDSQTLVTGDRDGLIQTWSTDTWAESGTPYSGHTKAILDLAISPDGTKLASIALDDTLLEWALNSTEGQKPLRAELIGGATAVAYSADSTRIVTGGNDLLINIWDAGNLTFLRKKDFSAKIVDIASLKKPNLFVIGGNDQKVALLDISGETSLRPVGNLQYPLTSVAASPSGNLIAAGDIQGGIVVWDIASEKIKEAWSGKSYIIEANANLDAPGSLHSLAFSPDENLIFSGLRNGTIRRLDAKTGTGVKENQFFNAHTQKMAVSHNSLYLITQQDDNTLTIWDIWNGTSRYQLEGGIKPGDPFSQDDRMFAVASASGPAKVNIYDPDSGNELHSLTSYRDLKTIQFTKTNAQLVTVYEKSAIHLWSTSSWQELETSPGYEVTGCLTYYDINKASIVSVTTGYQHVIADNNNRPGLCIFEPLDWATAINESQGMIVYGGNHTLAIVNAKNDRRESLPLQGVNRKNIVSIAVSPNGDLIAAAYDDHTIHIWDAATRDELTDLSGLYGHNNSITDLEFTPDGKLLISTSLDGTIRLWGVPY